MQIDYLFHYNVCIGVHQSIMTGNIDNVIFTSTSTALDKEADEIQQCCVSVYGICINPVIHHSLSQNKTMVHLLTSKSCANYNVKITLQPANRIQLAIIYHSGATKDFIKRLSTGCTCMALRPMLTTSNKVTASTSPFFSWSFSALPRLPLLPFERLRLAFSEHSRAFLFPLCTGQTHSKYLTCDCVFAVLSWSYMRCCLAYHSLLSVFIPLT